MGYAEKPHYGDDVKYESKIYIPKVRHNNDKKQGKLTQALPGRGPYTFPIPKAVTNTTADTIPPINNTIPSPLSGGSGNP